MSKAEHVHLVPESPTKPANRTRRGAGSYKRRPAGSLKQALDALVTAAGGARQLGADIGCNESTVAQYTDPARTDRYMPVDKLHRTHRVTDDARVLEWLAANLPTPAVVVRIPAAPVPCLFEHAQRLQREVAEYMDRLLAALRDGETDADEAGALHADGMDVIREMVAAVAQFASQGRD